MVTGGRMAPRSIFVTLVIICVSLSISEAFLAFASGSHRSSLSAVAASSSSRLWRLIRSAYAGEDDLQSSFIREKYPADTPRFSRLRRSSDAATSVTLIGLSPGPENFDASFDNGILTIVKKEDMKVKMFGSGFSTENKLKFDSRQQEAGTDCEHQIEGVELEFEEVDSHGRWGVMTMNLNEPRFTPVYICIREGNGTKYIHQGSDKSVLIQTKTRTSLPFGVQVFLLCLLLLMSGMFSGLNLGLMALDKTELQIVMNCGREKEKNYARKIRPVRNRGNYLLCTLLLSNVLVNSTLTILMDELTGGGGLVAIIGSTMGIVVFGEIIPQAVCSRHGLAVGAYTLWITKFFMLITFPVAFPISLILDKLLGEEIGSVYDRNRLRELIQVTHGYHDLKKEEMNIIAGALALSEKKVREIMTPLEDVFMISYDALLDFHTMSDIMKKGYTRIPVYDGERTNIVGLLNIKDLAFVDPDDCIPLKTLCKFYQHHLHSVFEDTKLDLMLEEFKKGQCHMALVQYVNNEGEGDPFYEIIGVVTLEDVIEEIIQSEILDETDVILDNKRKIHRELPHNPDFTVFYSQEDQKAPKITPQLSLAIFQFLSVNVEPFQEQFLSTNILRRLIKKYDVIEDIHHKDSKPTFIYERNKPADFFCLVLQGRVEVHVGKEDMIFETGPFSYFGVQALTTLLSSHSFLSSSRSSLNTAAVSGVPAPSLAHPQADVGVGSIAANQEASLSVAGAGGVGAFQRSGSGKPPIYVPDFSVKTTVDTQILKIRRTHYLAARRAAMLERQPKTSNSTGTPQGDLSVEDAFNKEWNRTMNHINNKLDQRGVRSASYREDRMGRDRRSTCSSTAKEPETSSETLPSPQNSDDLLGDGVDKPPSKLNGTLDVDRVPAPPSEATTISQSLGGATNPVDFCFSPSSLPPSISALASPLSNDGCLPSPASNSDRLPSPPPPSYASFTAATAANSTSTRKPPPAQPPSRLRIDNGDCGDGGGDGGVPLQQFQNATYATDAAPVAAAAATVPEVDLSDVAIVDTGVVQSSPPAEKTAFLSPRES